MLWLGGAAAAPNEALGPFLDVPAGHWALDAVNELANRGIVNGHPGGYYRGEQGMTRYEVAVAVQRVLQDPRRRDPPAWVWPEKLILGPVPSDVPKEHWAADAVGECRDEGIFACYPGAVFAGDRVMTRYEWCYVLKRLVEWGRRFGEAQLKYSWQQRKPPPPADALPPRMDWPPPVAAGPALTVVPRGHWAADAVAFERKWGMVVGYPGAAFGGDRVVTRYEFALGLQRLFNYQQRVIEFYLEQQRKGRAPASLPVH
jgi:hypothetical protein